ncbi:MAG: hypothetical protein V3T30_05630 [Thermodesulfobacteriota bacterium]
MLKRIKLKEYKLFIAIAIAVVIMAVFFSVTGKKLSKKKRLLHGKDRELTAFLDLSTEYKKLNASFGPRKGKLNSPLGRSAGEVLKAIGSKVGIGDKIISIKPAATVQQKGFKKRAVEVTLRAVSMNELVNFIYRIEESSKGLMFIKDFSMSSISGGSDRLNVKLQVVQAQKTVRAKRG